MRCPDCDKNFRSIVDAEEHMPCPEMDMTGLDIEREVSA
jgi:hypothetical protein